MFFFRLYNYYLESPNFSSKYLKTLSKGDVSPFFLDVDGKNPIFRYIYDLLNDGIRGTAKKDAVLAILGDISVSRKINDIANSHQWLIKCVSWSF